MSDQLYEKKEMARLKLRDAMQDYLKVAEEYDMYDMDIRDELTEILNECGKPKWIVNAE